MGKTFRGTERDKHKQRYLQEREKRNKRRIQEEKDKRDKQDLPNDRRTIRDFESDR